MATDFGFEPVCSGERYFIIYKAEDAEIVGEIARCLNELGVPLWYDNGLYMGKEWEKRISRNIVDAKAVIIFATKNLFSNNTTYAEDEYELASLLQKPIYVIWLDDIEPSDVHAEQMLWFMRLRKIQGMSFSGKSADEITSEIASEIANSMVKELQLITDRIPQSKTPSIMDCKQSVGMESYNDSNNILDPIPNELNGNENVNPLQVFYYSMAGKFLDPIPNELNGNENVNPLQVFYYSMAGKYLNPQNTGFEEALHSAIYVDKSEMIHYLNSVVRTKQKYVCVSRPRRFGKTMAADMLCAYYGRATNTRSQFEHMKLAACEPLIVKGRTLTWDAYLGQFDIVRLTMTDFMKGGNTSQDIVLDAQHGSCRIQDVLRLLNKKVTAELTDAYANIDYGEHNDLISVMSDIFGKRGRQFVIVIDEWDAVFRLYKDDLNGQTLYLNFLRDWLKDKNYVALAYMTGILPIKKYGEHSALNMFSEYSMMAPMEMAKYTGFTDEEVRELCGQYDMDYNAVSDWYDGYLVSGSIPIEHRKAYREGTYKGYKISIYSPMSVVTAVTKGIIGNYWSKTETYEALAEYIRRDYDGLKEGVALLMDGGRLKIDVSTYQNDMTTFHGRDDVLSLLVHLGYLGYDDDEKEVFIPNKEILEEFRTSTKSGEWVDTFKDFAMSQELLKAVWACDAKKTAKIMEDAHNKAGNKTYNSEAALSYAVQYAFYAAQKYYTVVQELDSGKGYVDIVYIPAPSYTDKPVLLIELKYDKSADTAMEQILRQKYPERLEHYKGNILLVGINYDKDIPNTSRDYKHHTCRIEKA